MASSSSSSSTSFPIPQKSKYEVFLSFRGEDTRNNFTSHLFDALERHQFHTFRDDERLEKGEEIAYGLLKAIEDSKIAIIVFSKNYANSSWCLNELVKIMECKQLIVLPIFYDVSPSEVRKQKGSFTLTAKGSVGQIKKWSVSLTNAANLKGWDLQNAADRDEAKVIKEIIQKVGKELKVTHLNVADHPVGLDRPVQKLETLLNMESNDVHDVAVRGSGGIGKTTTAKELYNQIHHKGCSFEVQLHSDDDSVNVVNLQGQLHSDLLKDDDFGIRNPDVIVFSLASAGGGSSCVKFSAVKSPPPSSPSATIVKKDPGRIGFLDEVGGNVDGLMSCTESLGFESSNERRVDDRIDNISLSRSIKSTSAAPSKLRRDAVAAKGKEKNKFPPPLPTKNLAFSRER